MWPQSCWPQGQCFPWNSPHVLGTGWACRESSGGCQGSGAPALRGSQRHLPRTHQRENLSAPPRAAPSQLETLKSCLGPGCGMGWDGSPHTCPPKPRSCSKAPLSAQKPLCAPLTLSWATQGEGRSSLQRDRGSCSERLLPCTGSPRDTQTSSPLPPHPQGDLCWRDFMFQTRFSFLTPPFQP